MSHIFISYSHDDASYASKLAGELETRGYNIWFDAHIGTGDRWFKTIVAAIRDCSALVVVMTPQAEESEWVEKEILVAQKYAKPIFPLLLDGKEFDLLITTQYVDVRDKQLPPPDFYDQLPQDDKSTDKPATAVSALSRQDLTWASRLFRARKKHLVLVRAAIAGIVLALIALLIGLSRLSGGTQAPDSATNSDTEAAPSVAQFMVRSHDFPTGFWSLGSHMYTITFDCPNDIYDVTATNRFEVSDEADLVEGTVQLRTSGLMIGGKLVDSSTINPSQPTAANIIISIQGGADEVNRILNTELGQCEGFISWDGNQPEELVKNANISVAE